MRISECELETILKNEIPITEALAIHVSHIGSSSVKLSAPLAENINHKSTAFGGSLYNVAVLSAWSLIYVKLNERDIFAHIVIQEGNMKYLLPVKTDFEAVAVIEGGSLVNTFKIFERKGIARIKMQATIEQNGKIAAEFSGKYVIHL